MPLHVNVRVSAIYPLQDALLVAYTSDDEKVTLNAVFSRTDGANIRKGQRFTVSLEYLDDGEFDIVPIGPGGLAVLESPESEE